MAVLLWSSVASYYCAHHYFWCSTTTLKQKRQTKNMKRQIKFNVKTPRGLATFHKQDVAEKIANKYNVTVSQSVELLYESTEDFEKNQSIDTEVSEKILFWAKTFPRERSQFGIERPSKLESISVMNVIFRKPNDPRNQLTLESRVYEIIKLTVQQRELQQKLRSNFLYHVKDLFENMNYLLML
jgi:hypothetical protein